MVRVIRNVDVEAVGLDNGRSIIKCIRSYNHGRLVNVEDEDLRWKELIGDYLK